MVTSLLRGPNAAVHSAEGRRETPLPRIGCNGLLVVTFGASLLLPALRICKNLPNFAVLCFI